MIDPDPSTPKPEHAGPQPAHLAHHFDTPAQQLAAGKLGMWLFLLTEILLFGGLFCVYAVFRSNHPEVFFYAERFLDKGLGALNTGILITSSLTMAWAVHCAQRDQRRGLVFLLALTLTAAFAFLGVKLIEYRHKWQDGLLWAGAYEPAEQVLDETAQQGPATPLSPGQQREARKNAGVFFSVYFIMTGLHAIHVLAGMAAITWLLVLAAKGRFGSLHFGPVDFVGLYWHLVDMIWIYLFPLLYLIH